MKQHQDQRLQLDVLAAVANLARSQYSALFKRQTGYAPMDYFNRLKMHRACQLLDTTQSSVKAIAASLGYEDPLYFSRVFRGVNKMPPQAYRQMRKG
jgi:AraC-like DNA-binding protein